MKHEDDYKMNEDSNLSHIVRTSKQGNSQGTMTLTENKEERLRKTKDLQCMLLHALASTTLTDFASVPGHFTRWDFRSALRVTNSIVVAVLEYSISDLYANSLWGCTLRKWSCEVLSSQKHHENSKRRAPRERKGSNMGAKDGKKNTILGGSAEVRERGSG